MSCIVSPSRAFMFLAVRAARFFDGLTAAKRPAHVLRQQVAWPDAQSGRKPVDVLQADVALSAFNATDVVAVEPAALAEFLLRPTALLAQFAHPPPDQFFYVLSHFRLDITLISGNTVYTR